MTKGRKDDSKSKKEIKEVFDEVVSESDEEKSLSLKALGVDIGTS